jgi:hypothetical protein
MRIGLSMARTIIPPAAAVARGKTFNVQRSTFNSKVALPGHGRTVERWTLKVER